MSEQKYTNSEKYQQEIAKQYKKRVFKFSTAEIATVLKLLGIAISPKTIKEAVTGNMNPTYLTQELAIKINKNREKPKYWANKIVSDKLSSNYPVVKTVAYDFFEKTDCEVLVMQRATGTLLLDDIFGLNEEAQIDVFKQVVEVVRQLFTIKFDSFGSVNDDTESFPTYSALLKNKFKQYTQTIRNQKLCNDEDIKKVEKYFLDNVDIFDNETPVLIHTDLHMGNILHQGNKLTAIIDFDSALRGPKMSAFIPLFGFIDNPSQFVEGTKDFPKYKGKNFYNFLPLLKEIFPDIFSDQLLLRKLNINGIVIGMMWIAGNWSADWNKEEMRNIVNNELPGSDQGLRESYYGKILARVKS
jgi:hypothetical protein